VIRLEFEVGQPKICGDWGELKDSDDRCEMVLDSKERIGQTGSV
jgi:hypothetical protein